jgi:SAM-dependent methyltransferase
MLLEHLDNNNAKILELGCGNSNLCKGLLIDGFQNITAVDISPVVITQLEQRHPTEVQFVCADVRDMKALEDGYFDHCVEKGCIDALATMDDGSAATKQAIREILRVLKDGGKFIQVSMNKEGRKDVGWARAGKWDLLGSGLVHTGGSVTGTYHVCQKKKGKRKPPNPPLPLSAFESGDGPEWWTAERDAMLKDVVEELLYDFGAAALAMRIRIGEEGCTGMAIDDIACRLRYAHLHSKHS